MTIGYMTDDLVRSYDNLSEGDWDDTVADGGITFGLVWAKQARDTLAAILPRICTECEGTGEVYDPSGGEHECDRCRGVGFMSRPRREPPALRPVERDDGMPF